MTSSITTGGCEINSAAGRECPFMNSFVQNKYLSRAGSLVSICVLAAQMLFAQNKPAGPIPRNRWLLVIETSRSMQPSAQAVQQIAATLALSGMNGEMRPGDTLGAWTYNETLHAGQFPLKEWRPGANRDLARQLYEFLGQQKYENAGQLKTVLPAMEHVIKESDFITVILISDGQEKLTGTPFDDKINATYAEWRGEQAKKNLPFVTLLRADHGVIRDFVVNTPPWPFQIPPLPKALLASEQPKKEAPPPPKEEPKPRVVQPLIIIGKKPEPEKTPPATQPVATNKSPEASAVEPAKREAATTNITKARPALPSAAAGSGVAENSSGTEPKPETAPVVSTPPSRPSPVEKPAPTAPAAEKPTATSENDQAAKAVAPAVDSQSSALAAVVQPGTPPVSNSSPPSAKAADTARIGSNTTAANSASAETAVAIPPEGSKSRLGLWVAICAAAAVAVVLIMILARRTKNSDPASLITRSLDREQK